MKFLGRDCSTCRDRVKHFKICGSSALHGSEHPLIIQKESRAGFSCHWSLCMWIEPMESTGRSQDGWHSLAQEVMPRVWAWLRILNRHYLFLKPIGFVWESESPASKHAQLQPHMWHHFLSHMLSAVGHVVVSQCFPGLIFTSISFSDSWTQLGSPSSGKLMDDQIHVRWKTHILEGPLPCTSLQVLQSLPRKLTLFCKRSIPGRWRWMTFLNVYARYHSIVL